MDVWQMPIEDVGVAGVDIWFAPEAPEGKESNWIPTKAGGRFELVFRFFGPEPPLFDKTWVLPDLKRMN